MARLATIRTLRVAGVLMTGTLLLTGCGKELYNTPLPGGAAVGQNPTRVTADFADVADLVPQSSVKVENIAVGRIESIKLNPDGRTARATLVVRNDVDLPEGTTARLQQTSLLGEKYIALIRPEQAGPSLRSGANIPIGSTSQMAEIEQVLGALSLVINGGGLAKFQQISRELQQVSEGRPEEIRGFLRTMRTFVAGIDARKGAITSALDSMAGLSKALDEDRDKISTALEGLSPGMNVLVEQRKDLVRMLAALDRLSDVSVRTLDAAQDDMVEDMRLLEPILRELAESGEALPHSLELLLTYPFPDSVLDVIKGDYFNVFATAIYSSLPPSCTGLGCPWPQLPDEGAMPAYGGAGSGSSRLAQGLLTTPSASPGATPSATPGATPSASPGATPSATPSGTPSSSPSSGPSGEASPSGQPGGESSPSASPGPSGPPEPHASPSLLPPTDSAMPGLAQRSVLVPTSRRSR